MIQISDEDFQTVYDGLAATFTLHDNDAATVGHILYLEDKAWQVVKRISQTEGLGFVVPDRADLPE
jgi:hypothetical protein